jgi:hypothetical protein
VLVLFEGSPAAVDAQLTGARALVGGVEAGGDAWQTSRRRQGAARGRIRFDPGRLRETLAGLDEAVVRAAAGVAYTPSGSEPQGDERANALVERIRRELDPNGVLAA